MQIINDSNIRHFDYVASWNSTVLFKRFDFQGEVTYYVVVSNTQNLSDAQFLGSEDTAKQAFYELVAATMTLAEAVDIIVRSEHYTAEFQEIARQVIAHDAIVNYMDPISMGLMHAHLSNFAGDPNL